MFAIGLSAQRCQVPQKKGPVEQDLDMRKGQIQDIVLPLVGHLKHSNIGSF